MAKYKTASALLQDRHELNMQTQWYIEKKGWKMTYVLPNSSNWPTLYEKEIDKKRVTMTIEHAFQYEAYAEAEADRGYEY